MTTDGWCPKCCGRFVERRLLLSHPQFLSLISATVGGCGVVVAVESNDLLDLLLCCLVRLVLSRQVGLVHRFAATPAVSQLN